MAAAPWNHNIHYHGVVLRSVSSSAGRALDVGCGSGLLARKLARQCQEVVAIDVDRDTLLRARANSPLAANIVFVEGDAMEQPFAHDSFDLIAAVATLHHLPLALALARFRDLLRPGGALVAIGLYRTSGLQDYAWAAAGLPASWAMRRLHNYEEVAAPLQEPQQTLREIRAASDSILPGSVLERRLFFRYSLTWRKP